MPTTLGDGPFLSLKHDESCGRHAKDARSNGPLSPFSSLEKGYSNGYINGASTGLSSQHPDEFLKLSAPQQDVLLLHGPRQRYSLEKAQEIPELKYDREILIQVLAIGLNPVDWKGPDYGFGQPSYPWVNGRDFAGIVVRAPKVASKIKIGDVVCGPSTDYRDVRKAAYQEYLVTTDYNVARVPGSTTVKVGAAIGVAYAAAVVGLGVSLGVDFSNIKNGPAGPDLYDLLRRQDSRTVPSDVRAECYDSLPVHERPRPGDWIAIWGASAASATIALQLAKKAGLKTICVADAAKHGSRLYDLGADVLVDRVDQNRAVDIIRSVTGGTLRFALDATGKESANLLQTALQQSEDGKKAHLIGLAGLPKTQSQGIIHHTLPIKIFHDVPVVGEAVMSWLEELLLAQTLTLPHIEVANGGLAGINDALDRLRDGSVSSKRIVIPIEDKSGSTGLNSPAPGRALSQYEDDSMEYHDRLNSDPNRVKFAYWVPNVSGGLVISKIPQDTKWTHEANQEYGQVAERGGFEYALSQIRFMAGYGAENQHESMSISQHILAATKRLNLICAVLPGPWNPALAAKQMASIDNYSNGRVSVNVVSGWFRAEFASIGQWWLDHAERYRRSREFIECLKGIWTEDSFTYKGDFYQFHDYPLKPKPLSWEGRPHPEIFQGGNSGDARDNAATVSDYYFMNGNTLDGFMAQIEDVKQRAAKNNHRVKFAVNGFVIVRDSEAEAIQVLQEIQGKADKEFVEGFRQQVQNAGAATADKQGMWANSKFEDLVQYNDGFKTKLMGTPEQIADRILLLKALGVSIVLTAFLNYGTDLKDFGEKVIPLVRKLEKEGRGTDRDYEIAKTGWIYDTKDTKA